MIGKIDTTMNDACDKYITEFVIEQAYRGNYSQWGEI